MISELLSLLLRNAHMLLCSCSFTPLFVPICRSMVFIACWYVLCSLLRAAQVNCAFNGGNESTVGSRLPHSVNPVHMNVLTVFSGSVETLVRYRHCRSTISPKERCVRCFNVHPHSSAAAKQQPFSALIPYCNIVNCDFNASNSGLNL